MLVIARNGALRKLLAPALQLLLPPMPWELSADDPHVINADMPPAVTLLPDASADGVRLEHSWFGHARLWAQHPPCLANPLTPPGLTVLRITARGSLGVTVLHVHDLPGVDVLPPDPKESHGLGA